MKRIKAKTNRKGGLINMEKDMRIEINKIKVVLLALWDKQPHPEATDLIKEFRNDIDEIKRGN